MTLPDRVGVFGGGRMGAGIAYAFLTAGADVVVIESSDEAAESARGRVARSVEIASGKQRLDEPAVDVMGRLVVSAKSADLAGCGLVVEAVPERVDIKTTVLTEAQRVSPDAWLATNTSSLSIDEIASTLRRPERLVGLHFFNPVPASSLVEIVRGAKTDPELLSSARDWVGDLGKTAITVTDTPGFASSRLGVAIALEAMRMVEDGVASAEEIDTAMTLGYRHPTGPLRTTDIVGLDVRLAIAEHLAKEVDPRFEPPAILREKVARGELGRKTGRGFFVW